MAKCRPKKWLKWAWLPALPLLAAYVTTTGTMNNDLTGRLKAALATDSTAWATIETDGRDVRVIGTAPSQEAVDNAVKAVAGTYGVRTIENKIQIVEPVALAAPTVNGYTGNNVTPTITGTWPEAAAKTAEHNLQVKLGDTTYELGKNPELTSDGNGNWQLIPSANLAEGSLDVLPSLVGKAGLATVAGATVAKAVIDLTPPAMPAFTAHDTKAPWPFAISGTWAEEPGNTLSATLNGVTYDLGKSPELTSDGKGNFTFNPKVDLKPGSYDIDFSTNDAAGNSAKQTLTAAIVIPEPAPAETPAEPEPKPAEPENDAAVAPMFAAQIEPVVAGSVWPYAITGAWDAKPGRTLSAVVAGRTYVLGRGMALTETGPGKFSFAPAAKLPPGSYDVDFITADSSGQTLKTTVKAGIVIPEAVKVEPPPPPPPHEPATATTFDAGPDDGVVNGAWDNQHNHVLSANFNGRSYVLDRGAALASTEPGKFTFTPRTAGLSPGSYDVEFVTSHPGGEAADVKVVAPGVIVVAAPPPPLPPPHPSAAPVVVDAGPDDGVINGLWDNEHGHVLSANFNGRTYVLDRGAALSSAEPGKFMFAPRTAGLAPGKYDVEFTTSHPGKEAAATTSVAVGVIVVAEPPPPPPPPAKIDIPAPTVASQLDLIGAPLIKGTWPSDVAKNLAVTVDGRTYELGKDPNLNAKGNDWTLVPGKAIADGKYDVAVTASDDAGNSAADATANELEVRAAQPAAPTVMTYAGEASPDHLSGTWDEGKAKSLTVTVPDLNLTAQLGAAGSPLTSDGKGNWRLDLTGQNLAIGNHAVTAASGDEYNRSQVDITDGEVVVLAKNQPPPTPYDCQAVMDRIVRIFPIRFEYDLTVMTKPYDLSAAQYAALLKDPRCLGLKVEIGGHADFIGSEDYNMGLAQRRADLITGIIKDAGVDASRLTTVSYGESRPLDPATSDEARAVNRRVEITVKP
jgi:outer membrane protein OmpA-like peptidoglycan-associated protein